MAPIQAQTQETPAATNPNPMPAPDPVSSESKIQAFLKSEKDNMSPDFPYRINILNKDKLLKIRQASA